MPNKKTAKYIGFSLISLSIATLLLTSIHSFKSYAENTYNVTKISSGVTINGADTVNENTDYSFTLTKDDPDGDLAAAFVDIQNAQHANFNTNELSLTPKILSAGVGSANYPKVTLLEDTDSPLKDFGGYKRKIGVNYDLIPGGTGNFNLYNNFQSADFWSSKPTTFSLGFWMKDESVDNVIKNKNLQIWPIYQATSPARYMQIAVPMQTLMRNPNIPVTITPAGANIPEMFQDYSVDAECSHQENGWSYYVINLKNIVYNEAFSTTPTNTTTYILFTHFSSNFRTPGTELEMIGITMTDELITDGYTIYPDTIGGDYKMYLHPKTQTNFTIPGQNIYGDMTITAFLKDNIPPIITGIEDNEVVDLTNNPSGITLNSSDIDIQTVTLTKNSTTIPGYELGQRLIMLGDYILTATDYSGNTTTLSFTITNSKRSVYATLNGTDLYIRTDYDDTQDIVKIFSNATNNAWTNDTNKPVDFRRSYLINKSTPTTTLGTILGGSTDDAAPLHINGYIGANHGQPAGTQIKSNGHGKTYADIGSVWVDSNNKRFNLIRIIDANNLLFLTDYTGDHAKYTFNSSIATGNLTHFSDAVNTSDITVESVTTGVQIYSALSNRSLSINCYLNGVKTVITSDVTDQLCNYVDIDEKYSIVNPSYIVETIVDNKPVGGYTSNPDITLGVPIANYNMIYRTQGDGSVLSIFNHKILEDVNFGYYGGLQYVQRTNTYGKQYRYIPGSKPFTANGTLYNLAVPFDIVNQDPPNPAYSLVSSDWENPNLVPDRQIDYYRDGTDQDVLAFTTGFLPLYGGTISERNNNVGNAINIAKKTYPRFIDSKAFETTSAENYEIKGIAYRKYFNTKEDANSLGSIYTIDHEGYTYAYLDFFSFGETQVNLSPELAGNNAELVYKSENVSYTINDTGIAVNAVNRDLGNGYLALKIDNRKNRTISFNNEGTITTSIVLDGDTVTKPTDPTKEGYTFKGWYTEDTFDNLFVFSTPIYADHVLYAKFEIIPATPPVTPPVTPSLDPKPVTKPRNLLTQYLNPIVEQEDTTISTEDKEEDKSETSETIEKSTTPTLYKDLRVKVYDKSKKPIKGAKVEIHSKVRTEITDKNGEAYFKNVEVGSHTMIISYKGQKDERTIDLTNDNEKEEEVEINVELEKVSKPNYWWIVLIVLLVILLGYKIYKEKRIETNK